MNKLMIPVKSAARSYPDDFFCRLTETPLQNARQQFRRRMDAMAAESSEESAKMTVYDFLSCVVLCMATVAICVAAAI